MDEDLSRLLLVLIIIAALAGLFIYFFGNKYDVTRPLYEKIFPQKSVNPPPGQHVISTPPVDLSWCVVQENAVSPSAEAPRTNRIVGWDAVKNACIVEYTGWSCHLGKVVSVRYAYTATVGGSVVWLNADGVDYDPSRYRDYIADLQKEYIANKPCVAGLYGR